MTSTLDSAVAAHRLDTTHIWATAPMGDPPAPQEYCVRCGRPKGELRQPDNAALYLPCRGFVG